MDGSEASAHRNDPAGTQGGLFATAHRPMFLCLGIWAVALIAWRYGTDSGGPRADALGSSVLWHAHEMLFGFAGAAFAGYTLTAAPSWSHRPPVAGPAVAVLTLLWIAARVVLAGPLALPDRAVAGAGAAFFFWLALLLGREAAAGRSLKGAVQAGFAVILGFADFGVVLGLVEPRAAILVFALILSVIGGRMVRAFTDNRVQAERVRPISNAESAGRVASGAILLALVATLFDADLVAGSALIVAAGAEAIRLALWQRTAVWRDALLIMLHLGYCWLPVGLALTGLARLNLSALSGADALHALTAGAMACLIYAVAARAVARRAPDRLVARWTSVGGFACLWAAAWFRLTEGMAPALALPAAALWITGWVLFLMSFVPTLNGAVKRPVFSGPRA